MARSCPRIPTPCHCRYFGNWCNLCAFQTTRTTQMLETNSRPMISSERRRTGAPSQQPRRLLLALALLLVALVGLLIKDRQFWFGTEQATIESDLDTPATPAAASKTAAHTPRTATTTAARKQARPAVAEATAPAAQDGSAPTVTRTVLPPLDVEVVAGDKHRKVRPGANAAHVELPNQPSILEDTTAATPAPSTNAAAARVNCGRGFQQRAVSASGAAHECSGIGRASGSYRSRWRRAGFASSERPRDSRFGRSAGRSRMAIQADYAERSGSRDQGPHHGQLHDQGWRQLPEDHSGREPA